MEIPVYSTKADKINLVANYLMNDTEHGWLFLIGSGGNGKTMATGEAVNMWRRSLGEDDKDDVSNSMIVSLPHSSFPDGNAIYKTMLIKKGSSIVKTIVHVFSWEPEWEFMAKEWNAIVARFERGTEQN